MIRPVAAPDLSATAAVALVGQGYVLTWDGKTTSGQMVDSGTYTLVVRSKDSFGAVQVLSTGLSVMRVSSVVRVSVYNSAGELVRQAELPGFSASALRLDKEQIAAGAPQGEGVEVRWGDGVNDAWVWDGTDAQGRAVSGGTYTVQVTREEAGKAPQSFLATVSVVGDGGQPYASALALPNPLKARMGGQVTIAFSGLAAGTKLWGRVYNLAGELIGTLTPAPRGLSWDPGRGRSTGIYLLRLEAQDLQGRHKGEVLKLCILN